MDNYNSIPQEIRDFIQTVLNDDKHAKLVRECLLIKEVIKEKGFIN